MSSWAEFAAAQPEFASRVRKLMRSRKHLTMATLRRDGSPRISGTEIQFTGDQLQVGSMPHARKAMDLLRDARVAIHGPKHDPANDVTPLGEAENSAPAGEIAAGGVSHAQRTDIDEVASKDDDGALRRRVNEA